MKIAAILSFAQQTVKIEKKKKKKKKNYCFIEIYGKRSQTSR